MFRAVLPPEINGHTSASWEASWTSCSLFILVIETSLVPLKGFSLKSDHDVDSITVTHGGIM